MPAGSRTAKDSLFDGFATVAKALASGRRAEIVELLAQSPRTVEEVADELDQSPANTSHHLRVLARAGLVEGERRGTHVLYRLASERVADLWAALRDVAADRLAEIDRLASAYLGDTSAVETVDRAELARRLDEGTVVLLDVRPLPEYEAGHIPGAHAVPVDGLEGIMEELSAEGEVVAYCRGPFCVYADEAVRRLHERGITARRLVDGLPEWRREGRPVAVGPRVESGRPDPG